MAEEHGPVLVSSGTIWDNTPDVVPRMQLENDRGEIVEHHEVLSYRTISVTVRLDDQYGLQKDLPRDRWGALRDAAVSAATARSTSSLVRFLHKFLQENADGVPPDLEIDAVETSEVCTVQVPGSSVKGRTRDLSYNFYRYIKDMTARTRVASHVSSRPPSSARTAPAAASAPMTCSSCGCRQNKFSPCCGAVFCRRCTPFWHTRNCTSPRGPLPMVSRFFDEDGEEQHGLFLHSPHPQWTVCRHLCGDKYAMTSYCNTEDSYYFQAEDGIRFVIDLYYRDTPETWAWRLNLQQVIKPRDLVEVTWKLYVASHYTSH